MVKRGNLHDMDHDNALIPAFPSWDRSVARLKLLWIALGTASLLTFLAGVGGKLAIEQHAGKLIATYAGLKTQVEVEMHANVENEFEFKVDIHPKRQYSVSQISWLSTRFYRTGAPFWWPLPLVSGRLSGNAGYNFIRFQIPVFVFVELSLLLLWLARRVRRKWIRKLVPNGFPVSNV